MDFKKYFEELKRRKVFKAAVAYLAVAWVLIEVASAVLPAFDTPPFVLKALILLLALGFLVNLVFSWVYDVTPEGLKKTEELPSTNAPSQIKGRRLNRVIIGFLSIAVLILAYNQFGRSREKKDVATPMISTDKTIKTIAVLPFKDNSPLGDHKWLTAGMVDAINNNLMNIEGLRVIASRSVDQLVNEGIPPDRLAETLELTHLLEGSVLRFEDNIRINVQLVSTDDYSQNWSRAFDQDMDSIYVIIDEVAASVGRELELEFNASKVSLPAAERTSSTAAYDLFLKAEYEGSKHWGQYPPIVRDYLEEAIDLDSTFYAAHALLGLYWSTQHTWDGAWSENFEDNVQKANKLLEFAIQKAPSYGDSYVNLAGNKVFYEQDLKAHLLALKGYELNPSTNNKLVLINVHLPALGEDYERNHKLAIEAMKESPYEPGPWAGKGLAEYFIGKHNDAIRTLEEGLNKFKEGNLYATAGRVFYALGMFEEVVRILEEYMTNFPEKRPARVLGYLAAAHYKLGNQNEYKTLTEELREQAATSPIGSPAFHLAMVNAQTGDHDAAFKWLDKAIEDKEVELYWLKVEPPFQPLYDDPRWDVLMEEMGFNDIPKSL
jgi:TolB-like protein